VPRLERIFYSDDDFDGVDRRAGRAQRKAGERALFSSSVVREHWRQDGIRGQDPRDGHVYSVYDGVASADQFDYSHNFYRAIQALGYPLRLVQPQPDSTPPAPGACIAMVDTHATHDKLAGLRAALTSSRISVVLHWIQDGPSFEFIADMVFASRPPDPVRPRSSASSGSGWAEYGLSTARLMQCFMRAELRRQEQFRDLPRTSNQWKEPLDDRLIGEDILCQSLYSYLMRMYYRPIDRDSIEVLIIERLKAIIASDPSLRPSGPAYP